MSSAESPVPTVAIFTMTYNQGDLIGDVLGDLLKQDYPEQSFEVIILDDGSTDDTQAVLESVAESGPVVPTILYCPHERDYMNARRWNQCIAAASEDAEVFIQVDDVRTRPDLIRQHVKWHQQGNPTLVTGAKFEGPAETWEFSACRRSSLAGTGGSPAPVAAFTAVWAASLSFDRRLLKAVWSEPHDRPYDERMEGWGLHEAELALRMQKAGARIVYDPSAGVFHRDHTPVTEGRRGLERERLRREGEAANARYLLAKHELQELPRW